MNKIIQPNQPLIKDDHGCIRFQKNPIVAHMLKAGGFDINYLAYWCHENDIDPEHEAQFAQLIGYSLDGWSTLSYVTDEKWGSVERYEDE